MDVVKRFLALQQSQPALNLYALVDGLQYEQHFGRRMARRHGINHPIWAGTQDEPLAHAGPWLVDIQKAPEEVQAFAQLEQSLPSVSWLITATDLQGLSQLLQLKLDAELPDGRRALLRFHDPRVLGNLVHTLNTEQRAHFFFLVEEWHFMYEGRRVWTGKRNA